MRQTTQALDSIETVSPTPFEVKNEALEDGVLAFTVHGELDLNTAPELERPLEEALSADGERLDPDRPLRLRVHRLDRASP